MMRSKVIDYLLAIPLGAKVEVIKICKDDTREEFMEIVKDYLSMSKHHWRFTVSDSGKFITRNDSLWSESFDDWRSRDIKKGSQFREIMNPPT